jgi:hypothetical protein
MTGRRDPGGSGRPGFVAAVAAVLGCLALPLACRTQTGPGQAADAGAGDAADAAVRDDALDARGQDSAAAGDGPADGPVDRRTDGADVPETPADQGTTAEVAADGVATACGASSCGPRQICVQPCTCGGAFICTPRPDGGTCPGGPCPSGGANECAPVCNNPPPSCMDLPAACDGTPSDTCLAGQICPGVRSGRFLSCACPP